jgi:alpha-tubulin suppressor-like RCC1 family protein
MSLQDDINNFNLTDGSVKLLELSAEVSQNTENRIISVPTVNDLPDLASNTATVGTIIYVESLKILVIAVDGRWNSLDENLVRKDFDINVAWSWGDGRQGSIGNGLDNDGAEKSSPVSVVGGFTDWCQVSAGACHSLGVRTNGTLWSWGCNEAGELGSGIRCRRSSPGIVIGGFTDWCQVSAGSCSHSLGVRSNGTAWAWGAGGEGRLGNNSSCCRSSPVLVVGFNDWCQVSAGSRHSLGIRCNGTAWAWGDNGDGRLGFYGCTTSSPVAVIGGFTDWCQVSAGACHSLGLRSNGTTWAWGDNTHGQLGDNTGGYYTDKSSPVSVVGGFTDWCQVSAGNCHNLGLRSNGTLWVWGGNYRGQLGDYTTYSSSSPVSVVGGFTDWCQVSAGCQHSLGVRTNGTSWSWGDNNEGQLGDGTKCDGYYITHRSSPVSVVGGFTDWCELSAGSRHSLGIRLV